MNSYRKFISISGLWLGFALLLNLGRLYLADVPSYIYLNWNVFLALLPVLFCYLFEKNQKTTLLSTLFFSTWFFLLPNTVYIVTDFIHLRDVGTEAMLWYDGMMIFAYTLVGVYAFTFSLLRMSAFVKHKLLFIFGVSFVSSVGIYLGRYIRWNTWDIFTRPVEVASSTIEVFGRLFEDPIVSLTALVFTIFMMVAYASFSLRNK